MLTCVNPHVIYAVKDMTIESKFLTFTYFSDFDLLQVETYGSDICSC